MRRHYTRERKSGPTPADQLASHVEAGLDMSVDHPALYVDMLNKARKAGPQRALADAIRSLRRGDELVVHDAATLGPTAEAIDAAMIAIGQRDATLIVWTPEPREYEWGSDAARVAGEMASLRTAALTVMLSEKHRRASTKNVRLGVQPKLVGRVREIAMEFWRNADLTAKEAHAAANAASKAETGVTFSLRLMQLPPDKGGLGKKMDVEVGLPLPKPPRLAVAQKRKAKRKPKRRKQARKTSK